MASVNPLAMRALSMGLNISFSNFFKDHSMLCKVQ